MLLGCVTNKFWWQERSRIFFEKVGRLMHPNTYLSIVHMKKNDKASQESIHNNNVISVDSTATQLTYQYCLPDSTQTQLISVRVESNMTHDSSQFRYLIWPKAVHQQWVTDSNSGQNHRVRSTPNPTPKGVLSNVTLGCFFPFNDIK